MYYVVKQINKKMGIYRLITVDNKTKEITRGQESFNKDSLIELAQKMRHSGNSYEVVKIIEKIN